MCGKVLIYLFIAFNCFALYYNYFTTPYSNYTDGERKSTIESFQVRHATHKHELHELTVVRTLSKASGLFYFIDFCISGMLANIHEYFNCCH